MTNMIQDLEDVRTKIAALETQEKAIVANIIALAKHNKLGQATYEILGKKITIKTGENVTLDKAMLNAMWSEELPVNRSFAYTLRQKDYDAIMKTGKPELRRQLAQIVTTSPAKPVVTVIG